MANLTKCPQCDGKGKVLDLRALGEELRKERIRRGISQRAVARAMKISASFLCDMERGNRTLTTERIQAYKSALLKS